jgi:hypothetical protein
MCDEILKLQTEIKSYRLLKFDKKGVHELDPNDFVPGAVGDVCEKLEY